MKIDLTRFNGLPQPHQNFDEWRAFIEFSATYLADRGVDNPVVVEIGTYRNAQREFYREFLNAEHIGIDIEAVNSTPDILGDSTKPETVAALKEKLAGRPVDLVFIDGHHGYDSVKSDYQIYGGMARCLVAFHDIYTQEVAVRLLWAEILKQTDKTTMEIRCPRSYMGIGLVLK